MSGSGPSGINAGASETAAARRLQSFELRKLGISYRGIGKKLGISEAQAHRDVKSVLKKLAQQELTLATEYRTLELERLDTLWTKALQKALEGDIPAVHAALRVSESRRRLLGMDEPVQLEATLTSCVVEVPQVLTQSEYSLLTSGNGHANQN